MISTRVVLDANVLYSAPVRDLMLSIAAERLFIPLWSSEIQNEWMENLLNNRKDLTRNQLLKAQKAMDIAFPEAQHDDYMQFIHRCDLPDEKDHHVLALAISQKAQHIMSFNQKDFPETSLKGLQITCLHPDSFACNILEVNKKLVLKAFYKMHKRLKSPPISEEKLLGIFSNVGLINFSLQLKTHLNL